MNRCNPKAMENQSLSDDQNQRVNDRRAFIQLCLTTAGGIALGSKLHAMNILNKSLGYTPKMPVLFLGHGSPMNAIEENEFVQGFRRISSEIKIPTPEHYLPLLYAMALQDDRDEINILNDKPVGGSRTMTSVKIG